MSTYAETIPDPATEISRREYLVNWAVSNIEHSEREHFTYRKNLPKIYELYRGIRTNQWHAHKAGIAVPLIYTICWSHVARIMNIVFGSTDAIRFIGAGQTPDEAAIGRKQEGLWGAQFRDMRGIEKMLDLLMNANLYSRGVLQHGWRYERGTIVTPQLETLPLSEEVVQTFTEREVINFDGPDLRVKDNLDCFPQPGFRDEQDMRWYGMRYWLDIDQVEQLSKEGYSREPIFDPVEVRRLKSESSRAGAFSDALKTQRVQGLWQGDDEVARMRERYARPVEILEFPGIYVPEEFTPGRGDRITYRMLTVANRKYLLRDRPFPYTTGRRPILSVSLSPDPHFYWGPGRGEIAAKMQIGVNKLTNQVLDALDVSIDPWFIFNRAAGIDPRNLFLRPGRWIPVSGNPSEMIMPGQANLSGLNAGIEVSQLLWQYMQRASGILDEAVIGVRAPGRSTARGDLMRSEAVAIRLVLEALLFEQQVVEPLADACMSHNRQWLTGAREFMILGDSATRDPVYGKQIPKTREVIHPHEILQTYSARATGTQKRMIQSDRVDKLMLFMQIIGQSPSLAAAAASEGWLRLIARELGVGHEANELLVKDPEQAQNMVTAGAAGLENVPNMNVKEGSPSEVPILNQLRQMTAGG